MTESQTRHTNHNSERTIYKMENINVMELVLHEIDIITKEQIMLVEYHNELKDRKLRLMGLSKIVRSWKYLQKPETIFCTMFQIWN